MKTLSLFLSLLLFSTSTSGSAAFVLGGANARTKLKQQLLDLAAQTNRGLTATPQQTQQIQQLFTRLEKLNPTRQPLKSPLLNADWSLEYTTSDSIIGKGDIFPKVGPIVQTIDTTTLSAANAEVVSYFGLRVPRRITAALAPVNDKLTNVQFQQFQIGPVRFDAPPSFKGQLDITYLDKDLRLTRGDKGNLFVLTRM